MSGTPDQGPAEWLFALFVARALQDQRRLFERLCRRHPDLRDQLLPMYRAWIRALPLWPNEGKGAKDGSEGDRRER